MWEQVAGKRRMRFHFYFDWKHLSEMKEINRWCVFLPLMIFLLADWKPWAILIIINGWFFFKIIAKNLITSSFVESASELHKSLLFYFLFSSSSASSFMSLFCRSCNFFYLHFYAPAAVTFVQYRKVTFDFGVNCVKPISSWNTFHPESPCRIKSSISRLFFYLFLSSV